MVNEVKKIKIRDNGRVIDLIYKDSSLEKYIGDIWAKVSKYSIYRDIRWVYLDIVSISSEIVVGVSNYPFGDIYRQNVYISYSDNSYKVLTLDVVQNNYFNSISVTIRSEYKEVVLGTRADSNEFNLEVIKEIGFILKRRQQKD